MNESYGTENVKRTRRGLRIILWVVVVLLVGTAVIAGGYLVMQARETRNLEEARQAIVLSDWEAASSALDYALSTQPAFIRQHTNEATALRGFVAYKQGDFAAALSDMEQALAANPGLLDLLAYRADIHFRQNQHDLALSDSELALEQSELLSDHLLAMLYANLAVMNSAMGNDHGVMSAVEAALPFSDYLQDQDLGHLYALRASTAYNLDDFETALEDTRLALSFDAHLADELLARLYANHAAMLYDQEEYDQFMEASDVVITYANHLQDDDLHDLYRERSQILYDLGNLTEAIDEAQQAVSYGEDLPLLHAFKALQSYQSFNEQEAMAEAEIALDLDNQNALAHTIRGTLLAWQGDMHAALDDLEKAKTLQPDDLDTLAMCVKVHLALNDLQSAELDMKQAVALAPEAPATLWAEAMLHLYNYEYEEARTLLDRAIALEGDRPEFYTLRSATYRQTADLEDARADLETALALNPHFVDARIALAGNRVLRDDFENMEQEFLALISSYPNNYQAHALLSEYHLGVTGDLKQAAVHAEKVVELLPESSWGHALSGRVYVAENEYEQALAAFEMALEVYDESLSARSGLADYYKQLEEYDQALEMVREIKALDPQENFSLLKEAEIYLSMGELEKAWIAVNTVLADDPENRSALLIRADVNMQTGNLQEAVIDVSRILDRYPRAADALLKRSVIHYLQGDLDSAMTYAERTLDVNPNAALAHGLLSDIALAENDPEAALRQANLMIEKDPEWLAGYYNQGLANVLMERYEQALASYSAGLEVETEDDLLLGQLAYSRAFLNFSLGNKEEGIADLQLLLNSTNDVEMLNEAEKLLAYPSEIPVIGGDRFIINDELLSFTISYAKDWYLMENDLEIGNVLSLYREEGDAVASVAVFVLDWEYTVDEFADGIVEALYDPQFFTSLTLDTMQIAGESGLVRQYETFLVDGTALDGKHYYAVKDDRVVFIIVETSKGDIDRFADEFELIAKSFAFIP